MTEERTDVIAYLRVSTEKQGDSGLGLGAQRTKIEDAADYKGWNVVKWIEDEASGKSLERPGIQEALKLIEDGGPDVLVAAKLDRIARSALDFLTLVERAEDNGWSIVVLDMGDDAEMDMTNPYGKFSATILAAVAELERKMIGQRTREAMAKAVRDGTHVGRPPYGLTPNPDWRENRDNEPQFTVDRELLEEGDASRAFEKLARIMEDVKGLREDGATLSSIADHLNAEGVPTASGKEGAVWRANSVKNLLRAIEDGWYGV